MKPFRKIRTDDRELDQVQSNIANVLTPISKAKIIDGAYVDVVLVSGTNRVGHKLNRKPEGWVIGDRDSAADVYRTAWDDRTVDLVSSGDLSCRIWFF